MCSYQLWNNYSSYGHNIEHNGLVLLSIGQKRDRQKFSIIGQGLFMYHPYPISTTQYLPNKYIYLYQTCIEDQVAIGKYAKWVQKASQAKRTRQEQQIKLGYRHRGLWRYCSLGRHWACGSLRKLLRHSTIVRHVEQTRLTCYR